jgi:putative phosphoesterase
MRIAVFSDVHGNLTALEAVIKDMAQRDLEGAVHLGDLVGYGPRPNEAVARVKELDIPGVVGNYDLAISHPDAETGLENFIKQPVSDVARRTFLWTYEKTSAESREFLMERSAKIMIEEGPLRFLFTHGSPERPNEYLFPDTPEERLVDLFEATGVDVMVVGHTHLPMARQVGERLILNPGSVGRPKDGDPRASYMILDTEDGIRAEQVRVQFDVESVARDCVDSGLPKEQADGLRRGLA